MKRRGMWSVTIIIASALLYYYSTNTFYSSLDPQSSIQNQALIYKDKAAANQSLDLSSQTKTSSVVKDSILPFESAKNDQNDIFFGDNPERLDVKEDFPVIKKSKTTVLPTNQSDLESSRIWPAGTWQVWQGVRVVSASHQDEQGKKLKELGSIGSYVLMEDVQFRSDEHQFQSSAPIPVFNQRRNKAGLITGVVTLVLREGIEVDPVLTDFGLFIKTALPQIRTLYVAVKNEPYDLVTLIESLKQDSRIEKVDLEVVTQNYAKK